MTRSGHWLPPCGRLDATLRKTRVSTGGRRATTTGAARSRRSWWSANERIWVKAIVLQRLDQGGQVLGRRLVKLDRVGERPLVRKVFGRGVEEVPGLARRGGVKRRARVVIHAVAGPHHLE